MTIALSPLINPLIFESTPRMAVNNIYMAAAASVCHRARIQKEKFSMDIALQKLETELQLFVDVTIALIKDPEVEDKTKAVRWMREMAYSFNSTIFPSIATYARDRLLLFSYYNFPPTHPLYPTADDFLWLSRNSPVGC